MTCQDHYVEYYNSTGFCSGVLYQSGPFNYKKFSQESSTIIQAPKVYTSNDIETYMSFVNNSITDDYIIVAEVKCAHVDEKGDVVKQWVEKIPPRTVKFVNLNFSNNLSESIETKCFYAVSTNAVLLPLTFSVNKESKTLALEHSLPPMYYSPEVRGAVRAQLVSDLNASRIFPGAL